MRFIATAALLCLLAACSPKPMHSSHKESTAKASSPKGKARTSAGSGSTASKYSGNRQAALNITRVTRASQQTIIPGIASKNQPYTEYRMTVLWKEPKEPNNLLLRMGDQWIECSIKKKVGVDTLYLYGKNIVKYQVKISDPVANNLYFNNFMGDWKFVPVNIKKLPDVKMH
jgi:hypothetical protein